MKLQITVPQSSIQLIDDKLGSMERKFKAIHLSTPKHEIVYRFDCQKNGWGFARSFIKVFPELSIKIGQL